LHAIKNVSATPSYEPELIIKTAIVNSMLRISIRDNGTGIPDEIKDKVFLPFFTTKPTGEGTGLGLSLSHDIVTKGNDGELSVKSEPGNWTEFQVLIPKH
jgi:signal transduction histidine kinase